ncbi:protein trapped in endoderm-1-like [Patiria miniata]|uniref:G-protein coupled receptors family 1 profile domain-containing protein n=1 Tax=Patiria miniata TaxID=46514 RepID=A0A914AS34_PATMI|nr:protein trapped in endoderm-1-like [Patiria miniata]
MDGSRAQDCIHGSHYEACDVSFYIKDSNTHSDIQCTENNRPYYSAYNYTYTSTIMNATTVLPVTASPPLYSYQARIGLGCVWVTISILGLIGNSLVIWSVVLSKKLRTVTNAFVVNLSLVDFWTSLSYPWQAVAILSHGSWPLATEVPCYIAAVQFYTGLGGSLYSLAAIAFNRFMLVTQKTETYSRWYSPGKVSVMIAATWVIPSIVFFLPPILGIGDFGYDPQDNTCSDKDGHPRGPEYNLAQSLGLYPIPMLIIVSSYTALYIHLKRHFRKQKRRRAQQGSPAQDVDGGTVGESTVSFTVVSESSPVPANDMTQGIRREISRQQLAITKNLFMVFFIFFLLMSPYFISLAIPSSGTFALYGATISMLNSCVNPIIYTAKHPQFKLVLRNILRCRYSQIPEPSDWLKSILSRWK